MPQIFSDRMVLQRDLPVQVWGWSEPGNSVTVRFAGQEKSAMAAHDGRWQVVLDPMPASFEPRKMQITSKSGDARTIQDVLVGEVWFTAGQSNMMMGLNQAEGGEAYYEAHKNDGVDKIRVVNQLGPFLFQPEPQTDIPAVWNPPAKGYSAVSFWFAHKLFKHFEGKVPVGMITYTAIYPAEGWVRRDLLEGDPRLKSVFGDALKQDAELYNGVISAIAPYSLRGVLYYQAEYNANRAAQFRTLMPTLISCWREAWQRPELPFLFVQLPGFVAVQAPPSGIDMDAATLAEYKVLTDRMTWTEMREAQLDVWKNVPKAGMAIAIDVGETYDIHPKKKEPIADRLLLQARKVAYGEEVVASGPIPRDVVRRNHEFVVTFDEVGSGLQIRGDKLEGFEVAGKNLEYHPAEARIDGDTVIVTSGKVPDPVHLRYAWDGNPLATLENKEGLPATPFRHVDWAQSPQPDRGAFSFPNPGFEELDGKGVPTWWTLVDGAKVVEGGTGGGRHAIAFPESGKSCIRAAKIALGVGGYWNAPPLQKVALRPGCLVSYSADLSVESGDAEGRLYMNLCADASGSGYQAWGGMRTASVRGQEFVTRRIVQRMSEVGLDQLILLPSNAGVRFINQSKDSGASVLLDNLSDVEILRPTLELSSNDPIDFGTLPSGQAATSPPRSVWNGQADVRAEQLAETPGQPVATILYGLASFQPDAFGEEQKLAAPTDHVGAVLIGPEARLFEFQSPQAADPNALKFVGTDGKGGLEGGPKPERQEFLIGFKGADKPGVYSATLRIVTQAGNIGKLSQGGSGEPPIFLYYLDIPIRAEVR